MFGLSLALTVSLELQPSLAAGANVSMHTAVRQKEAFLLGPYLDFLPAAVVGQVRALEHGSQDARAVSAGRRTSVIGNVTSTTAATTVNAAGMPTASPSNP